MHKSPLSPALELSLLLIPFVVVTGSAMAHRLVEDRRLANLLTPALALCALLLPLQLIGRYSGSFTAVVFHLVFWLNVKGATWQEDPVKLAPRDVELLSWLRTRVPAGQLVFRSEEPSTGYNQHGGLASPWLRSGFMTSQGSGFLPRFPARTALLRDIPADPEAYRRENIFWFVLEENDKLLHHATSWIQNGQAELVLEHNGMRVIRLR